MLPAAGVAVLVSGAPELVLAQAFDVDSPDIKQGEREIKNVNTSHQGYPPGTVGTSRRSHEISFSLGVTDQLKLTAHFDAENVIADPAGGLAGGLRGDHLAIETQLSFLRADRFGLGVGWFTSIQAHVHDDATNSLVYGPIVQMNRDVVSLTLNSYFEKTFGANHTPGTNLLYGWQLALEARKGFTVAIEGFGKVADLANAGPLSQQDHRIGPTIAVSIPLDATRTMTVATGVLVGLTEATPDATWRLSTAVSF